LVQEDLVGFCKKNGIEVTAYCPLARNMANPGIIYELVRVLQALYSNWRPID